MGPLGSRRRPRPLHSHSPHGRAALVVSCRAGTGASCDQESEPARMSGGSGMHGGKSRGHVHVVGARVSRFFSL